MNSLEIKNFLDYLQVYAVYSKKCLKEGGHFAGYFFRFLYKLRRKKKTIIKTKTYTAHL